MDHRIWQGTKDEVGRLDDLDIYLFLVPVDLCEWMCRLDQAMNHVPWVVQHATSYLSTCLWRGHGRNAYRMDFEGTIDVRKMRLPLHLQQSIRERLKGGRVNATEVVNTCLVASWSAPTINYTHGQYDGTGTIITIYINNKCLQTYFMGLLTVRGAWVAHTLTKESNIHKAKQHQRY